MKMNSKLRAALVLATLSLCPQAEGASQKLEWEDEIQCLHEMKFDPRKYDGQRLLNTIDMIFNDNISATRPLPEKYLSSSRQTSLEDFTKACAEHADQFAKLPVIDLPGIENYRNTVIDELRDECRFERLRLRAKLGEASALREYTPSAAQCSRFIDALEGKADIRPVWIEVIEANCAKNYKPAACRTEFLRAENQQNAADRIRSDVLNYGWTHCSAPYQKVVNNSQTIKMVASLQAKFKALFKIRKPHRCHE
jgi:hypothetical protein